MQDGNLGVQFGGFCVTLVARRFGKSCKTLQIAPKVFSGVQSS